MWPWPLSMTLKFNRVLEDAEVHVYDKFHQAECSSSWVIVSKFFHPNSQWWKILKSGPVTLTIKFYWFRAVIKEHVHPKFHRAECSGSRVIVRMAKKLPMKTILPVATLDSNKNTGGEELWRCIVTSVHLTLPVLCLVQRYPSLSQ